MRTEKWIWRASCSLWMVGVYLLVVFAYDATVVGIRLRTPQLVLIGLLGLAGMDLGVNWLWKRLWLTSSQLKLIAVNAVTTLVGVLTVDLGYAAFRNGRGLSAEQLMGKSAREGESQVMAADLFPPVYFPTEKNFWLYKPGVNISAKSCGDGFFPALRMSPTLATAVREPKQISYAIGEDGFRETLPLDRFRLFALGDSFVFGAIDQEKTWVKRLEQIIRKPVCNLGVAGTSPKQQEMILEHLLQSKGSAMKVERLFWMVFEGNDLEDSYEENNPFRQRTGRNLFQGTFLESLARIPCQMQQGSVIGQLTGFGRFDFRPGKRGTVQDPTILDLERKLGMPVSIYHSPRFGYRCFYPPYIERAGQPRSYVLNHPNRPLLDRTLVQMQELGKRFGFEVVVLLAPSDARLYGQYFEGFPSMTAEPHFLNYVEERCRLLGVRSVNLAQLLQPYAKDSLLHWRDDSHWNELGNEIVSRILARELFGVELAPVAPGK